MGERRGRARLGEERLPPRLRIVTAEPSAIVTPEIPTGTVARINVDDSDPVQKSIAQQVPVRSGRRGSTISRRDVWGRRQRFEARRVRRLIRQIDPWSVLKLSVVFFVCVWVMFMVAAIIVWTVARTSGTIDRVEGFVSDIGFPGLKLDSRFIFRQYGLVGLILVFAATAATTVASIVFNLISDIIGGVWITVIEEETARPTSG